MQDTSFERTAYWRAGVDDRLVAGGAARRAQSEETHAQETNHDHTDAIAQSIAETLTDLEADDSEPFELGAMPLDSPDPPPQQVSTGHSSVRQRRSRSDSSSRLLLMAMLVSALLALGMVGFAVTEGFIP